MLQAVKYADSQDIDGNVEEINDDQDDEDFVARGGRVLARKMF